MISINQVNTVKNIVSLVIMNRKTVCVFCGSSDQCDRLFLETAYDFGARLAAEDFEVIFGGGRIGLMGALADGVNSKKGKITGIIPRFMQEDGWGNTEVTRLRIVDTMHERKSEMIQVANAFAALPGGLGTFEELFEVITWKQLGLHEKPVLLLNTRDYFRNFLGIIENCISENFMNENQRHLWTLADVPEKAVAMLNTALQS